MVMVEGGPAYRGTDGGGLEPGSVAVGGDLADSTIVTGDDNTVRRISHWRSAG